MPFVWHPNSPPPEVEEHSKAKLNVFADTSVRILTRWA